MAENGISCGCGCLPLKGKEVRITVTETAGNPAQTEKEETKAQGATKQ